VSAPRKNFLQRESELSTRPVGPIKTEGRNGKIRTDQDRRQARGADINNGQRAAKPGKKRDKHLVVRIDAEDYAQVKKRAAAAGARTISAYLRRAALDRSTDIDAAV
jgi:predicted DNA binding CopG/RHH family protein